MFDEYFHQEVGTGSFIARSERVKISYLGDITACNVERIPITEAYRFTNEFRCQKPVIFTDCVWSLSNKEVMDKVFVKCHREDVELLISKDNKNFLYNDLCMKEVCTLRDAFVELENNEDKLSYLRLYASKFPQIFTSHDALTINSIVSDHCINKNNIGLWISTKGCITPCHFDLCHGLLNQIHGTKTFILCPPSDASNLYYKNKQKGLSAINVNNSQTVPVNFHEYLNSRSLNSPVRQEYPLVQDCAFFNATLNHSDMLYTPPGIFLLFSLLEPFHSYYLKFFHQVGFIMLKVILIQ